MFRNHDEIYDVEYPTETWEYVEFFTGLYQGDTSTYLPQTCCHLWEVY